MINMSEKTLIIENVQSGKINTQYKETRSCYFHGSEDILRNYEIH